MAPPAWGELVDFDDFDDFDDDDFDDFDDEFDDDFEVELEDEYTLDEDEEFGDEGEDESSESDFDDVEGVEESSSDRLRRGGPCEDDDFVDDEDEGFEGRFEDDD